MWSNLRFDRHLCGCERRRGEKEEEGMNQVKREGRKKGAEGRRSREKEGGLMRRKGRKEERRGKEGRREGGGGREGRKGEGMSKE